MFKRIEAIDPKNRYKFESHIGRNISWWQYYSQYKNIVDELVDGIERNVPIDTVSLPLLFLVRHSLELGLKANILKLQKINSNVTKVKLKGSKSHSIEMLHNKFIEHLNVLKRERQFPSQIQDGVNTYLSKLEPLKDLLHSLDKGSYNFRYPVDTEGIQNFEWSMKVQVADIMDLYYEIQSFLIFTETVLNEEGIL